MDIPPEKLIVIPGNHDKLLRRDTSIYFSQFVCPLQLTKGPTPQSSYFLSRSIAGTQDRYLDLSCFKHIAGGEVSDTLYVNISSKLKELQRGNAVDSAELSNYANATKILLVHYAVDPWQVHGYMLPLQEWFLPHSCPGLGELIASLRSDLRLVIHGHLHHPKIYNTQGVQVISATTTTQRSRRGNGFFLLKFFASGDIRVEHHKWGKNGFIQDPTSELNMTL